MLLLGSESLHFWVCNTCSTSFNHENLISYKLSPADLGFAEGVCWTRTAERQTSRIRMEYLRSVLRQEVGFFDNQGASSTTFRVVSSISADAHSIQAVIAEKVSFSSI